MLPKVMKQAAKALYAIMISCDKLVQKEGEFKEILTPVIHLLALMGASIIEINQFRQDLLKHKLPANFRPLAKDVPQKS